MDFSRKPINKLYAIVFTTGFALSVQAQSTLEEIVVTAQKREQNVQDVPIAITAVTGESMEVKALTQVSEVAAYAPNVYMDPTTPFGASNNILAAYIRGIGQSDFAFNLEPGVGVYVDGVYMARTIGANLDLLDVDRIEVLKGPQGTLFGRNTIGGAINVITRKPTNEFQWRGEVTTGSFNRLDVRGAVEGALIDDTLYGLVAFSSKNRDGYQENRPYPGITDDGGNDRSDQFIHKYYNTSDTNGGENQDNIRAKLVWDVNEDLTISLSQAYSTTDEDATATSLLRYYDNASPGSSFTHLADLCTVLDAATIEAIPLPPCIQNRGIKPGLASVGAPQYTQPALADPLPTTVFAAPGTGLGGVNQDAIPGNDRTFFGNAFINGNPEGSPFITSDPDVSYASGPNFSKLEIHDTMGHVDYDLANGWQLKYIGAFRYMQFNAGLDFDSSPLPMLEVSFDTKQKQWSHELQLTGLSWEDRWEWVGGFYYFHEEGDLTDFVTFPGGFLQIYGENFFDTDAWAVFTHNNFAVNDQFSITFGLRYTDEDKDFEGRQRDLNMVSVNPGLPLGTGCPPPPLGCSLDAWPDQNDFTRYYPLGVNNKGFTDLSLRGGLEYKFNDDVMAYFSYAEGFKSGGWTTRLSAPHLQIDPLPAGTFVYQNSIGLDFDAETATTYEIGLKSEWLDRTLLLNLAGFFSEYDNIQVTKQDGPSPVFANAGDGEILGFEAEALWLATDNLSFEASLGWMDAEYTSIDPGVNVTLLEDISPLFGGTRTPLSTAYKWNNVPEWDISLAANYVYPLPSGARLTFRGDWSHTSEMANDLSNTPQLMQDDVDDLNFSATYTNPTGNWDLVAGGRNVTDERHIITGQIQPAAGMILGTYNRPAEWFLTLRIRN
jgi:iron complex outermembrane receptor protein